MDYKPMGKGVLISFDAEWKRNVVEEHAARGSKIPLSKDFGGIFKRHLEQMYAQLYVEKLPAGDDATAHSLYVEEKGVKAEDLENHVTYGPYAQTGKVYDLMEHGAKMRFYDVLGFWGHTMSVSNLKVRKAELGKVRQVYGAPEILAKGK